MKIRNYGLQKGERWLPQNDPKWLALCKKEKELLAKIKEKDAKKVRS